MLDKFMVGTDSFFLPNFEPIIPLVTEIFLKPPFLTTRFEGLHLPFLRLIWSQCLISFETGTSLKAVTVDQQMFARY